MRNFPGSYPPLMEMQDQRREETDTLMQMHGHEAIPTFFWRPSRHGADVRTGRRKHLFPLLGDIDHLADIFQHGPRNNLIDGLVFSQQSERIGVFG